MINCKIKELSFENGKVIYVLMSGHAGFSKRGSDIVCAGVSALYHTLVQSIDRLTDCRFENKSDELIVFAPDKKARLLINSFLIGMQEIEFAYPDYINVE